MTTMTTAAMPSPGRMYRALVERDSSYEGVFVVGVKTTGIFCRPTCPARKPKPETVEYFTAADDAVHAGYRPCRRCRPLDDACAPPEWVKQLEDAVDRSPTRRLTDIDLRAMGIDPARVRRYFRQRYGMTFHAYHRARRMGLALAAVRPATNGSPERSRDGVQRTIDTIGLDHGYGSASGFRDAFSRHFGAPPGRGDRCTCLRARRIETPLGAMLAVSADDGLCLLEFVDRRGLDTQIADLRRRLDAVIVPGDDAHLATIADEMGRYFAGELKRFTVPLVQPGTDFQRAVWRELRRIPFGATRSYAEMATNLGRPGAHRAIGHANGRNRIAIVVPCHRVIRTDGSLCGYAGGVWRKQRLLEIERGAWPTAGASGEQERPAITLPGQAASRRSPRTACAPPPRRHPRPPGSP